MVTILAVIILSGLLFIGFMIRNAFLNRVIDHDLFFDEFPESFGTLTIFFISDIHKRSISDQIIQEAKGKADLVVVGGDLTEKKVPLDRVEQNVLKLKQIGPVYFVWGNNDYEADYHMLDAILLKNGVKILDNTAVVFESGQGEKISLLGIDDLGLERDRLDLAVADADEESFRILISHNPAIIHKAGVNHEIPLILSGHTHGGQIRFFGIGPYSLGGIRKRQNSVQLVSNGYGTTTLPFRLGALPETHIITLKNSVLQSKN
ncbi:metallophosphoesterase [Peribacillus sp. SCS-155]|uniref:metallophosphoesterase n=1 Tax=Peribacillus sedimenti TaxID=3115297 RepID=UPI0039059D0B